MLGSHPEISSPGECDFLFDLIAEDGKFPAMHDYKDWLSTNRIFREKGLDIDQTLPYPELIQSFIEQLQLNKKVLSINVHRNFSRIPGFFPDAKYIHLLRDPRDVARSCLGMGWVGHPYYGADIYAGAERSWDILQANLESDQYVDVRYEDLILHTVDVLKDLCGFMGVAYSASMMDYVNNSTYGQPDSSLVFQWKRKYTKRELQLVEGKIGELIVSRGYELSDYSPTEPGILEKWKLYLQNKLFRFIFDTRRYGLMFYLEYKLSRKTGLKPWMASCQMKINLIDTQHLK